MSVYGKIKAYPRRAWIVVASLVIAFVLGGGEAKSPSAELLVQIFFAFAVLAWIWLPGKAAAIDSPEAKMALLVPLFVVVIPLAQLIPLPPTIWHALPGREAQVAALSLVGASDSWRPVSEVPLRTLATLLSMLPPLALFYGVAQLDLGERSLIPRTVLIVAVLTALLGGLQVLASDGSLTFYQKLHAGWVTGFQSNRNHAADVLLAGLLALAFTARRRTMLHERRPQTRSPLGNLKLVAVIVTLLLIAALVMTGSRAGIALGLVCGFFAVAMMFLPSKNGERFPTRTFSIAFTLLGVAVVVGGFILIGDGTGVTRVAARFADMRSERSMIWADASFAWWQYWPVGIGAGGFTAAMFPAERLEFINITFPNQAHNDFLEIGIEAGLAGYLTLLAVWVTLAILAWRSIVRDKRLEVRLHVLFAGSVLILLTLHSVVDYPLRSMSLACLAGAAGGMLVRAGRRDGEGERARS